ncbi:carbon-nitrogen hydrolase family protein [Paradesulfitobacterium ferrireducens]|uniref:carbon-nitrogen hydrolase family protein n=1 Tax=Paradesulfitobacterium ferrireducens TaxID=2816476 RepID=UPI001A8F0EE8|nr:carbon-nitrogen hydrolase family protein [Paradesulfitobacterium ferrireducens]
MVKVAAVQMDPKIGQLELNLEQTRAFVQEAAREGAKLVVFPECSLTGYCFASEEEARSKALVIGDQWTTQLHKLAAQLDVYVIVGFVELLREDIYNTFLVVGPEGVKGHYRKAHLPTLGVDNFTKAGTETFELIETSLGKIGPLVCYDARFPEQSRILSLKGADILVHITNLPLTASAQVDFLLPTRANENRVFVLSSDRVGEERGYKFLGRSSIYGVDGEVLAQANNVDETIIYADLDFSLARQKEVYYPASEGKPADHINYLFGARRPDLYKDLSEG